jgi:hypothetical protein
MINDIDTALADLLKQEMPIKNNEVDLEFFQPKREWAARLNRPTLNLFLYELHENIELRRRDWQQTANSTHQQTKRPMPHRVDLHYMITAWASEPEDEHSVLTRALLVLLRTPEMPAAVLPESLKDQPYPISLRVAEPDALRNAADIWGVLDNEIRPAITCVITLALNPYTEITGPLIRERKLSMGIAEEIANQPLPGRLWPESVLPPMYAVGGTVKTEAKFADVLLLVVETGQRVALSPQYRYQIGNLRAEEYTVHVLVSGKLVLLVKITVPSPSYDIELSDSP